MPRLEPETLNLVFQFELFLLKAPDLNIVYPGTTSCSIDPFLKHPVLFCQFRKMSCHRHQDLLVRDCRP